MGVKIYNFLNFYLRIFFWSVFSLSGVILLFLMIFNLDVVKSEIPFKNEGLVIFYTLFFITMLFLGLILFIREIIIILKNKDDYKINDISEFMEKK